MMRFGWYKKGLVFGIILLFVGLSVTSSIGGYIGKMSNQSTREALTNFPLDRELLAYWKFDECSGTTAYDSSGHDYDGIIYGATWVGHSGACALDFDGVDDYVDLDAHSENLGFNKIDDYIISAPFKFTSSSGMIYSMSHTDPARVYVNFKLNANGTFSVHMGDETCLLELYTIGEYNDGCWHYVEVRYYGDIPEPTLEIYVDDELDGSVTKWLPPFFNDDFKTAKIGRRGCNETNYFDGIIDEVKIYKFMVIQPPTAPTINGPQTGRAGTSYTYEFQSYTSVGRSVSYYIKWGDGDITNWTTFLPSGTPYKEDHTFGVGTFTIQAQAKDETGLTSGWSELTVTMPRNKATSNVLVLKFFERFPNAFPILRHLLGL